MKALFVSRWPIFCIACLSASIAIAQGGQSAIVFRIGTFDRSSAEFAGGAPKQPVDFIVGESSPAKDWYAAQPAELVSAMGTHPTNDAAAPRTITFSLPHAPAVAYRLRVSLLIEGASVPALRVNINGKHGTFFLQPKLDSNMGDMIDSFDPAYSHADVTFNFPGSYLHSGTNTSTISSSWPCRCW